MRRGEIVRYPHPDSGEPVRATVLQEVGANLLVVPLDDTHGTGYRFDAMASIPAAGCTAVGALDREQLDRCLRQLTEFGAGLHYQEFHQRPSFEAGKSKISYAGRVYDEREILSLLNSCLDFWLTAGPYAKKFESGMADYLGSRRFYLVNSGSSANLLMVSALCSPDLLNRLEPGDEVITPAVTFPTTLAPIVQNQLVPVFVDCDIGTYNVIPERLEEAVGPRTRAIFVPHTLGNPNNMDLIQDVVERHDLFLLEDSCDALGATFDGQRVGTFGSMASFSFFPAHHITMGEGGGVAVNNRDFLRTAASIRDWGRDCWCDPGHSSTCKKRFGWDWETLPFGYDHKYVYSNIGYNLKATDMQAAIGLAQLEKIDSFVAARRDNFEFFYEALAPLQDRLILPRSDPRARPSWFGFPITVRDGVDCADLVRVLEGALVETRKIFAGNILQQPGFRRIEHRISGSLANTDKIMRDSFFIGVYPGLTAEMREFVAETITDFFRGSV